MNTGSHGGDRLVRELYGELRNLAAVLLHDQPPGHTLQATALVNEAYLRLDGARARQWNDRAHFLATAARTMRWVLVDHARERAREKRTAPGARKPLDAVVASYEDRAVNILALDEALESLSRFDPEMARAVELRLFGGLDIGQIARFLDMPRRTFERRWKVTRVWLHAEVG